MPKLQHPSTNVTPEFFRELAEQAIEELYENADSMELHDVRVWRQKLVARITAVAEHRDSDGGREPEVDGE